MPRKATWPPKVSLHKASGQSRVTIAGRDHYIGKHGSPEAKAAYARLIAELANGRAPAPKESSQGITVTDLVTRWWLSDGARYKPQGDQARQYRDAMKPLLRLHGPTLASDFRCDQLETVRMAMATASWLTEEEKATLKAKRGTRPIGLSGEVCNRRCGRIKSVWRWAERAGLVPEGRWAHLCSLPDFAHDDERVRHGKGRSACTEEELNLVLAECLRPVKAMLLMQWHSGMRSGEVRIMRPGDIDRTAEIWIYKPHQHKTAHKGQSRLVALGARCQELLAPFLAECASVDDYIFRPTLRRGGKLYRSDTYAQAVRRAALAAGVPHFSAYACRHAFKRRVCRAFDIERARASMGHATVSTTTLYSAEQDMNLAIEVAKKLG